MERGWTTNDINSNKNKTNKKKRYTFIIHNCVRFRCLFQCYVRLCYVSWLPWIIISTQITNKISAKRQKKYHIYKYIYIYLDFSVLFVIFWRNIWRINWGFFFVFAVGSTRQFRSFVWEFCIPEPNWNEWKVERQLPDICVRNIGPQFHFIHFNNNSWYKTQTKQ